MKGAIGSKFVVLAGMVVCLAVLCGSRAWSYEVDDKQNLRISALEKKVSNLPGGKVDTGAVKKDIKRLQETIEGLQSKVEALRSEQEEKEKEVVPAVVEKEEEGEGCYDGPLNLSGFFDINWSNNPRINASDKFGVGAFEIDMEMAVSDKVSGEAALVWDGGAGEVGVAFLDFHFFEADEGVKHPPRGHHVSHTGLLVGLNDVPFGLDYLVFATPDRKLVSTPLTTDMMFDGGWADVGIVPYYGSCCFDLELYYLDAENIDDTANPYRAVGGRLAYTPGDMIDIGVSAAGFFERHDTLDKMRVGGHASLNLFEMWETKAEYIKGKDNKVAGVEDHEGYYVQSTVDFAAKTKVPLYLTLRYGFWNPEFDNDANSDTVLDNDDLGRFTAGIGWCINESVLLKAEHQVNTEQRSNIKEANDVTTVQLVLSF